MDPESFHFFLSTQLASVGDPRVVGKCYGSQNLFVFWEGIVPKKKRK
jgi:hypothetical protein